MKDLSYYLGLPLSAAVAIVIATVVMYAVFILVSRTLGQRILAKLTGYDLLVVIVLGALIGRTMLGWVPTLGAGLIALGTLLVLEVSVGALSRRGEALGRWINNPPVMLVHHGKYIDAELRRCHVTKADIRSRLRLAGVGSLSEVAAVILEPTGELSVLREGAALDKDMLAGVRSVAAED